MKKGLTKVLIAGIILFTFTTNHSSAQSTAAGRFSIGVELGLPTGDFGNVASVGIGGSLRYEHPLGDNVALTLTGGYLVFGQKTVEQTSTGTTLKYDYTTSMIPVQAGLKYYFMEQQNGFYVMVEAGIHSFNTKVHSPSYHDGTLTVPEQTVTNTSTDFSYAPEIGYHLGNIDLGVRYQLVATTGSTTTYAGIRLAYVFGESNYHSH